MTANTAWKQSGACYGDLTFTRQQVADQQATCAGCRVRATCLAEGKKLRDAPDEVWGGELITASVLAAAAPRMVTCPCGTTFATDPKAQRPRRFCSPACGARSRARKAA